MITWIDFVLLGLYALGMIGIAIYTHNRSKSVNDFLLAGKKGLNGWMSAFAYGTTYFSAVIFIGYAGKFGSAFGLASIWIGVGNAIIGSLLAWMVLAKRTKNMTHNLNSKTMPDFFEKRYGSQRLKLVSAIIIFIFLIPYSASVYSGLSALFETVFRVEGWIIMIALAALTAVYLFFGGYFATALSDFIQGIIMLGGIVAVIAAVLNANGGLSEAIIKLSQIDNGTAFEGAYTSFLGPNPVFLLFVVLLTSLGTWGLPQMVGKFYSIKDEDAVRKGTIISTLFAIVVAGGCYFLGGFGRLYADILPENFGFDAIIPTMLSTLPDIIIAVVIMLVLAASMSTLSSLVLTSASTLTLDVVVPYFMKKKDISQKKSLFIMRVFIVFFIAVSAVIAILKDMFPSFTFIAQMMGVSWGALAGAFLAPFLYGLYSKKITRASVWVCFVWGVGLEVVQLLFMTGVFTLPSSGLIHFVFQNSLYSGVFAMVGGLILAPIVSSFTGKQGKEAVDDIFSCYERKVLVNATDALHSVESTEN